MKVTTSIHDILRSELQNNGFDEFMNNSELVLYNEDYQFIKKMINYDDDIHQIVTKRFFQGFTFETETMDKQLKKMFINRFLNRQISRQTIEDFSSQLVYITLSSERFITTIFNDLDKYLTSQTENMSSNSGNDLSDTRTLFSSLPQNNVNLNIDDTVLDYGDNNNIARSRNQKQGDTTASQKSYDLEKLLMTDGLIENYFKTIDKKCFLQTW